MVKKLISVLCAVLVFFLLTSFGLSRGSAQTAQIANPWRSVTEEEAKTICPASFRVPDGADSADWSVMDQEPQGPLVQLSFDLDGMRFTAREQAGGGENAEQAGMFYTWTVRDDIRLENWNGSDLTGTYYRYLGEGEYADLCVWYDPGSGVSYSLGVTAADLDGFDLEAVAEALNPAGNAAGIAYDQAAYEAAANAVKDEFIRLIEGGSEALENFDESAHPELPRYTAVLLRYPGIGYYEAYYDFDGNGVPEMLIGSGDDTYRTPIALYAFDGQSMRYLCKDYPLGERSHLGMNDGMFTVLGSGGADNGIAAVYRIAEDGWGTELVDVMEYRYSGEGQISYTSQMGRISPEEAAERRLAEYSEPAFDVEWQRFYPAQ